MRVKKRKSKYGSKNEILFPEDVEWIESFPAQSITVINTRQRPLPLNFEKSAVRTAPSILPTIGNVTSDSLESSPRHKVLEGYGHRHGPKNSAESMSLFPQKDSTKQTRCNYCCGFITFADHDHVITHQKKHYHTLCFEYVLNPEDKRRRLPRIPLAKP